MGGGGGRFLASRLVGLGGVSGSHTHCFLPPVGSPGKCGSGAGAGSRVVTAPRLQALPMGPRHLLLIAALLLGRAKPLRASLFCGRLEYWNPDNRCCGSCLQRFGPPSCPDHEFTENCGLSDYGDHLAHPFQECAPGRCNPDGAELCRPCGGEAAAPAPARSSGGRRRSCRKRRVPSRKPCRLPTPSVLGAQEPSPPAVSSASWSPERGHTPAGDVSLRALQSFALPVVVVSLATFFLILLLAVGRRCCRRQNATPLPYTGLVCSGLDTLFPLHTSSPGSLKAPELGNAQRVGSLLPVQALGPPTLATQPLSRLLDELEVLEELIVLLDPEPGPGGSVACGTTRHLAAQYGLPAAWSTFAYSLRPSCSPLRALLEVVVAREPTACLGQLATHLARLGRADALQVLSKLS